MEKLNKSQLGLLLAILTATDATGNGFVVENAPATKVLVEQGLIETNADMKNGDGEIAARVTNKGREVAKASDGGEDAGQSNGSQGGASATSTGPKVRPSFTIKSDIPVPTKKTRAPVAQKYPFDELQVGQSFFVPDSTVSSGDAFATLNSTVTGANKRWSEETGEMRQHRRDANKQVPVTRQLRQFEAYRDEEDGEKGARVFRVEVKG